MKIESNRRLANGKDLIAIWRDNIHLIRILTKELSEGRQIGKYTPLYIRMLLYLVTIKLKQQGHSIKQIRKLIYDKFNVKLNISTINTWVNGKSSPFGRIKLFNPHHPSVGRILGATLAEGWERIVRCESHISNYRISIRNKDLKYINYVKDAWESLGLSTMVNDSKHSLGHDTKSLEAQSSLMYLLIKHGLYFIVHAPSNVQREFLKALFGGDGSFSGHITLYNTNLKLLAISASLLRKFGIHGEIRGPYRHGTLGRKKVYCLVIDPGYAHTFADKIGVIRDFHKQKLLEILKRKRNKLKYSKYTLTKF